MDRWGKKSSFKTRRTHNMKMCCTYASAAASHLYRSRVLFICFLSHDLHWWTAADFSDNLVFYRLGVFVRTLQKKIYIFMRNTHRVVIIPVCFPKRSLYQRSNAQKASSCFCGKSWSFTVSTCFHDLPSDIRCSHLGTIAQIYSKPFVFEVALKMASGTFFQTKWLTSFVFSEVTFFVGLLMIDKPCKVRIASRNCLWGHNLTSVLLPFMEDEVFNRQRRQLESVLPCWEFRAEWFGGLGPVRGAMTCRLLDIGQHISLQNTFESLEISLYPAQN